jgi:molybdopterin synthase sulfur carrier subunit
LSIIVRIPPPLRKYTGGAESVETTARNLAELLDGLAQKYPGFKQTLCTPDGTLQRFMNIYVNDEDIRFLGGAKYAFQDGDEVLLIPAIAGGSSLPAPRVVPIGWQG